MTIKEDLADIMTTFYMGLVNAAIIPQVDLNYLPIGCSECIIPAQLITIKM